MDVSETSVLPVIISKIKILLRKKQQTFFVRLEYLKKESFLFLHVTQKLGKYIFTDQVLIAMIMSFYQYQYNCSARMPNRSPVA